MMVIVTAETRTMTMVVDGDIEADGNYQADGIDVDD